MNLTRKSGLVGSLVLALGRKDPKLATMTAVDAFPAGPQFTRLMNEGVSSTFASWALDDPEGALEWYQEKRNSPRFQSPLPRFAGTHGDSGMLRAPLISVMLSRQDPRWRELVEDFPPEARLNLVSRAIDSFPEIRNREWELAYLRMVREAIPEDRREEAVESLVRGASTRPQFQEAMGELMGNAGVTAEERKQIARTVAEARIGTRFLPEDPARMERLQLELKGWLETAIPDQAGEIFGEAMDKFREEETMMAEHALLQLRDEQDPSDDRLVRALTSWKMSLVLDDALGMAEKIRDPQRRQSTIDYLNQQAGKAPLHK